MTIFDVTFILKEFISNKRQNVLFIIENHNSVLACDNVMHIHYSKLFLFAKSLSDYHVGIGCQVST